MEEGYGVVWEKRDGTNALLESSPPHVTQTWDTTVPRYFKHTKIKNCELVKLSGSGKNGHPVEWFRRQRREQELLY